MKDKWLWNPKTERILDMKYRKSYSRRDFKEIFKILVKTERRLQDLRRMASKSEKERQKWKKSKQEYCNDKNRLIEDLKHKNSHLSVGLFFHKSKVEQIEKIINESETKEEIVEKCKMYNLIGESFTERKEKSTVPPAVFNKEIKDGNNN